MASIAEWIEKIKTAIYGEEVRGAIWQSLEAMNTEVEAINVDEEQIERNKNDISTCKTNIATNTAAITALNSSLTQKTSGIKTSKGVDMNQHKTYKITLASGEAYPIFFMCGQSTGSIPFAMVISAGGMFSATPTINYNAFVGPNAISNVTASNGVITIEFTSNYAQFFIMSKHGFTGEIV